MWEYIYPDELYHHGVKGMKWGVRKTRNTGRKSNNILKLKVSDISPTLVNIGKNYVANNKGGIVLPKKLYGHVIHEIRTHAEPNHGPNETYTHNVDSYKYTVRNHPGDIPELLDRKKITKTIHNKRGGKK